MRKIILSTLFILGLSFLFILRPVGIFIPQVSADETEEEKINRLSREIEQYENEIKRLKTEAGTLANQVAQFDAQIRLTSLKIAETEEKIFLLGGRIDQLEGSLSSLTKAFTSRVIKTYKMSRFGEPSFMLLAAKDLNHAVSSYHYLQRIQEADRDLLVRLEKAQVAYIDQKSEQETLQQKLQDQKNVLGIQKTAKASLLAQTKNDEIKYQQLLAQSRSEFEAIQAIIAGKGDETKVGKVNKGERIATIIQGASCNSSGEHLHFIARQGNSTVNPFTYLKPEGNYENCSGSSCGSPDGDLFNPVGSWDWPIRPKIKLSQGYGSTWATRNTWVRQIYSFHNGIDINSDSSSDVLAVEGGTLFRGSYGGSGGCRLRYVRVDHDNTDFDTLYLHINY